jgi:Ca-activated chloride channel family protein
LQHAQARRLVIVLLSDGQDNFKSAAKIKPREAAQFVASLGIPIYAIDAGGELASTREPIGSPAVEFREAGLHTLREIAKITGGECFPAHDAATLIDVCGKIDRLERARIESFQYRKYREAFPWVGLAAFVLFLGVLGLEMTVWQRIP